MKAYRVMANEKRLEKIRKSLVNLYHAVDIDKETKQYIFNDLKIEWLIERVEELEEAIADYAYEIGKRKRALNKKNEQNKRYREAKKQIEEKYEYFQDVPSSVSTGLSMAIEILDKALEGEE